MTFNQQLTSPANPSSAKASLFALLHRTGQSRTEQSDKTTPISAAKPNQRNLAWTIAPNLLVSFKYAWAGVCYAFATQRNFRIHTGVAVLAVSLGLFLQVSAVEMAVVGLTCALVMVLELLNTALESVVDLTVQKAYHELAKIAKDCAAGAVLIAAIAAIFVASLILLPPLYQFLKLIVDN
ncbi:diacylglycerol kinase family protein [Spirulina sp. CS-785/01]|uniref:diacylglycerol kinase family protein n=1 Tax=Spirulina sp. CS-785/01 TaxID=3021716 RepID=UPI0023305BAC|nr:diacylglycerol kinase family protein [Spirulina sp. CS-785/01]MDB9312172.1 diacylglycerol kinase family protein [Spirulina sp. CS-785/01]